VQKRSSGSNEAWARLVDSQPPSLRDFAPEETQILVYSNFECEVHPLTPQGFAK